ncbi:MAG: thioredoxin [Clostridia bacterium]|nr:thioredoxin [Clostridia bacterium]MCI8980154.1 thioredoxin [Clostridia bacterium]MCI9085792.1 thioredoxin [Clostridia bacterium]
MEITLTSSNYDSEVLKSDKLVLVDFWASWCGPCKMVSPIIEQLAKEYDGKVKVCKLNVDDEGSIAAQNAIVSIPTVILFENGKPVKKLIGAHSLDDYEDAIDELL